MSEEINTTNAIETEWDGYRFRSRLEARWAVFFKELNVDYLYEHEGFELHDVWYLPDFYLKNVGLRSTSRSGMWVEVKPALTDKNDWCSPPISHLIQLVNLSEKPAALVVGDPDDQTRTAGGAGTGQYEIDLIDGRGYVDHPMEWVKCTDCGKLKYEFSENNYMGCEYCGGICNREHPEVVQAIERARKARFEHGERP